MKVQKIRARHKLLSQCCKIGGKSKLTENLKTFGSISRKPKYNHHAAEVTGHLCLTEIEIFNISWYFNTMKAICVCKKSQAHLPQWEARLRGMSACMIDEVLQHVYTPNNIIKTK
ncbi:hypothetical protein XENOCAPTIV_017601 [Xenoophorus captivus]|uniref:Uncharacterized protein n=1 Tax=Xenoophorus captivus TaxID=1517983 RepID=A0ABV0R163_9TELE